MSDKEYGRRPYMNVSDTSHFEEMRRITDKELFNIQLQQHSELKKPYMVPDYEGMEYYYDPYPNQPYDPYSPDWGPENDPGIVADGCVNADPMRIINHRITLTEFTVEITGGASPIDWAFIVKDIEGELGSTFNTTIEDSSSRRVTVNYEHMDLNCVKVIMHVTSCGDIDRVIDSIPCPDCPPETPTAINTGSSSTTINQNGTASISVESSITDSTFAWTLSGSGYSFDSPGGPTTKVGGKTQIIHASAESCGACDVTIEDTCDAVVSTSLRNLDSGIWVEIGGLDECLVSGIPAQFTVGSQFDRIYGGIKGKYKVEQHFPFMLFTSTNHGQNEPVGYCDLQDFCDRVGGTVDAECMDFDGFFGESYEQYPCAPGVIYVDCGVIYTTAWHSHIFIRGPGLVQDTDEWQCP